MRLERSSSDRGVARFCCVLGEYLSEEVFWTQINQESLMRSSAPAMVGGRCHDDHQEGGDVELFSSEGSSFFEGGDGGDLKNLVTSQRVGFLSKVCGGPGRDGHLSELQEEKCLMTILGCRHLPAWCNGEQDEPFLQQVLPWEVISSSFEDSGSSLS